MSKALEQIHRERLENVGLFVSEPYPENHVLSLGVIVGKPTSTRGNSIENFKYGYEDIDMDAPDVTLFFHDGYWIVMAQEGVPEPGPGDFTNRWNTVEEAVEDIIDFFLGDPTRMKIKEKARLEVRARIAKWKEENQS
ncbi:MAG: hypothetical protein KIT34_03890 [Cyanobacteria bacterium TGS_CYA1]|nr:hypothetical protein [Cyanobacteria bacterium TGS_CYA1]